MSSKSISKWCESHGLSRGMFYNLDKIGKAPKTFNVLRSRRISDEADAEWVKAREAESQSNSSKNKSEPASAAAGSAVTAA